MATSESKVGYQVIKASGKKLVVHGAVIDGALYLTTNAGYSPAFSADLLAERGLMERVKPGRGETATITKAYIKRVTADPELMACCLRLGENEDGTKVIDIEAKSAADRAERERAAETGPVVFGRGSRLLTDLPKALRDEMKKRGLINFEDRDHLDDIDSFDMAEGYAYSPEAMRFLMAKGRTVQIGDVTLSTGSEEEITAAWATFFADRSAARAEVEAEREEASMVSAELMKAFDGAEAAAPGSAEAAEYDADLATARQIAVGVDSGLLNHITGRLVSPARWGGRNQFGSGRSLFVSEKWAYDVYQNGHDGDHWASSNTKLGIAVRVARTAEMNELLDRAK